MAIKFHIIPEYNLAVLAHVGATSDIEFLAFYKKLFEGGQYDPAMNHLVDLRQADSTSRSSEILRQFAEYVQEKTADMKVRPKVAVVAPEDISFGLARMYEFFAGSVPWDFVVFRAWDAAVAWLGLPEDLIESLDREG